MHKLIVGNGKVILRVSSLLKTAGILSELSTMYGLLAPYHGIQITALNDRMLSKSSTRQGAHQAVLERTRHYSRRSLCTVYAGYWNSRPLVLFLFFLCLLVAELCKLKLGLNPSISSLVLLVMESFLHSSSPAECYSIHFVMQISQPNCRAGKSDCIVHIACL